jgi:hypothetical protein
MSHVRQSIAISYIRIIREHCDYALPTMMNNGISHRREQELEN